jgi:predicted dehydrogenase
MLRMGLSRSSPLRVGLLGYGLAGRVFHAPLIAATGGLRLVAVVTTDPGRRAQVLRDYPGTRLFDRSDELIGSGDVDLVVVATPNRSHVAMATLAVQAGLPVVVDKPLAATSAEGRQVVEEARRRSVSLTVFQNRRWDGDFLTVRRLMDEGVLGTVLRFESRFERWRPEIRARWREQAAPEDAGGLLFDLGAHLVDQAAQLFGPVESVYAEIDHRRAGTAVDDDDFVALAHANGTRSHLWMSVLAAQLGPRMRVVGDKAGYTKYGLDGQEAALGAGRRPGDDGWGEDPPAQWGKVGTEDDLREVRTEPGRYEAFYAGLVAALQDGAPLPVDPAESVAVLEILEAARRSAARRETVHVAATTGS